MVYHKLSHAIRARYIRFRPTAWHGHISMRVEVYGCKGNAAFSFSIPLIKSAFLQCFYSDLDRNSIICHYFWQHQCAFVCNLISKATRIFCPSNKLLSVLLDLPNFFINELDLAANSQYLGKEASFNPVWQGRYTPLDCWYFWEHKLLKSVHDRQLSQSWQKSCYVPGKLQNYNKEG